MRQIPLTFSSGRFGWTSQGWYQSLKNWLLKSEDASLCHVGTQTLGRQGGVLWRFLFLLPCRRLLAKIGSYGGFVEGADLEQHSFPQLWLEWTWPSFKCAEVLKSNSNCSALLLLLCSACGSKCQTKSRVPLQGQVARKLSTSGFSRDCSASSIKVRALPSLMEALCHGENLACLCGEDKASWKCQWVRGRFAIRHQWAFRSSLRHLYSFLSCTRWVVGL